VGRAAGRADLDAVSACLTSAFYDDPVWGDWAFPERAGRAERLCRLMRFWAQAAIGSPWVRMTRNAEAAAVWIPPGVDELTTDEETAFRLLVAELFGPRAGELGDLFERFDQQHPRAEPHYYLSLWGRHREQAGSGLGTALMNESLARIDAERMPAYLESTNPANLGRYESLGFRRRAEFGPPGGPLITTMWRASR
jgi:hypothetical protein